jgi:hypothetical protein
LPSERQHIVGNFIHELDALVVRGMIDAALQDATSVAMSSNLDAVSCHCVINELPEKHQSTNIQNAPTFLTWLSSGASLLRHFRMTWFPLRSLMSTTTWRLSARIIE